MRPTSLIATFSLCAVFGCGSDSDDSKRGAALEGEDSPISADAGPGASMEADPDEGRDWSCLPALPRAAKGECKPAYEPTFENVFANTLSKRCGFSSCHSAQGKAGGLVLGADVASAHHGLTEPPEDEPYTEVVANNPECSPLMMRLESEDPSFAMPPRSQISAEERCAITQWIADGAPAPGR